MGKITKKKSSQITLDEKIALAEEYTRLWAQFFNFFGDGFEGRKITSEGESQFFRAMTELARKEFRVSYFVGPEFKVGPAILGLLSQAVSLTHIHEMSESNFAKFQYDWHVIFVALNKSLGRLIQLRPLPRGQNGKSGSHQVAPPQIAGSQKPAAPPPSRPA